ncbi:MAG: hypothetical protein GX558_05690 [Clostridiales bacterium]|nr:hypothetical protein [Clostridiales bacterium]
MARPYTQREVRRRRANFKILAGLTDFFGSIVNFVLILVCVVVLTTLIAWFRHDIVEVFSSLLGPLAEAFQNAV